MIDVSNIVLAVEYGLALGAIPAGICLLTGIFWRVVHIMS